MKNLADKKLDKNDPMNFQRKVEKEKRKAWRETNAHTKWQIYKAIGIALAEKLGIEVPIVRIDGGQHIIYTAENGTEFTIKVTQKRSRVNYHSKNVIDICSSTEEDYDRDEWLKEIEKAIKDS